MQYPPTRIQRYGHQEQYTKIKKKVFFAVRLLLSDVSAPTDGTENTDFS